MIEKIAVLGSNSFSGSHFVAHALDAGASVLGLSRSPEPLPAFLPYWESSNRSRFHFLRADLNSAWDVIARNLSEFQPDYVVNFASQSMVAESWANPEHWFQTNVMAQIRLHEYLRVQKWLKKYVHISTPEVYGSCSGLVREDSPYNPTTPYAVSRAAADMSLQSYFKRYQFPVVFTRAANVYGPGQQLYRLIPRTILSARLGKKLPLHGGGASVRSFIHIKDVCVGTLAVMRSAPAGEIYHLSTGLHVSIRQVVEMICKLMDKRFEEVAEAVGERPGKDLAYTLDSEKIRTAFQWKDSVSLEFGLKETIDWIDRHIEKLSHCPIEYHHQP